MAAKTGVKTPRWKRAEDYVLNLLTRYDDAFENHNLTGDERGDFLPRMRAAVPGQHARGWGIDVFAVDPDGWLWIIEVSIGTLRGAARFKGGGNPVGYADGGLQMSEAWRLAAADAFLRQADGPARVRALLDLPTTMKDATTLAHFGLLMERHRKAIILPEGAHFDAIATDVDFVTEVYTHRFPSWFLAD